ncbi:MAG: DMT family transporter [Acidobacteria bacterium]|nr:DMT family transporter [Acidobacteriota bacterium]
MTLLFLLCLALAGFAANSLLTRGALEGGHMDPMTFMVVRLVSGAAMLALLVRLRHTPRTGRGSWAMAAALAGYAVAFTLAYTHIPAGAGALLLFAAVHLTMFSSGLLRGERPAARGVGGTLLAATGLVVLTAPGLEAPSLTGAVMMTAAGLCWGLYSLAGRRSADPLATTADNFIRATLLSLPVAWLWLDDATMTSTGIMLAVTSGAIASGLAYAAWYAVLPHLAAWRAALLQLAVPVITAVAAVFVLSEPLTSRLLIALALVIGGIGITTVSGRRPPNLKTAQ